jgi:hypothetical protein
VALRGLLQVDVGHPRLQALRAAAAREGKSANRLAFEKFLELGFLAWLDSLPAWGAGPRPSAEFDPGGDDDR